MGDEVYARLEGLPTQQFATVAFYVDLLADQGPLLGERYPRQLDGKLRELRFHLQRSGCGLQTGSRQVDGSCC